MFTFESLTLMARHFAVGKLLYCKKSCDPFIRGLSEHNIIVTGFHNHWLFENPRLMYFNFEKIEDSIHFARILRKASLIQKTANQIKW